MTISRETAPYVATRRFGLGARPGETQRFRDDPRGAVLAQLIPEAARFDDPALPSTKAALLENWAFQDRVKQMRAASPPAAAATPLKAAAPAGDGKAKVPGEMRPTAAPEKAPPSPDWLRYAADAVGRLDRQISTSTPMVERLVNFWSNHFCIAAGKGPTVRMIAGAYEREAIRPFVLGRFHDMLLASARHPAMLAYLDNNVSIGPNSRIGQRFGKGLNENLGREILELHTLGVDGGYSQADVTAFSKALTGWSFGDPKTANAEPGTFHFFADRHEPGAVAILGKTYHGVGVDQATEALADFARHPATARHVAGKLVRHFVGDAAPPELAERLASVFRATDGDLAATTRALVEADAAWTAPPAKILSPWDLLVASGRMLGMEWTYAEANRMLSLFGQPLWNVPFPKGWPDDDEAWAAPASLMELLDAVAVLARRNAGDRNVRQLADDTLGPLLDPRTRRAVARAENRETALALLLMSPDFLRR